MDRDVFERQYRHMQEEEDPFGIRNNSGLTDDGIARAEADLQAVFPPDYEWFLRRYWTGLFGSLDLYTMQHGDQSYIGSRQPTDALGRFVAFSDDGFGNAFCFPVDNGACVDRVVIVPLLASEYTGETVDGGFLDFVAAREG